MKKYMCFFLVMVFFCWFVISSIFSVAYAQEKLETRKNDSSIRLLKKQYQDAIRLFKQKKYIQAKQRFLKIFSENPEYKRTRWFISKADKIIEKQEKKEHKKKNLERRRKYYYQAERNYREILSCYKAKRYTFTKERIAYLESFIKDDIFDEKYRKKINHRLALIEKRIFLVQKKEHGLEGEKNIVVIQKPPQQAIMVQEQGDQDILKEQQKIKKDLMKQCLELYIEAEQLYHSRLFSEAQEIFQQVEEILPDFRFTRNYLNIIKKLEIKQKQRKLTLREYGQTQKREDIIRHALDDIEKLSHK